MPIGNNSTGAGQLSSGVSAGHLAGVGVQLAQGVPVSTALKNAVKDSAIDSLLGPTALFAGGLVGALKTMRAIVDQSGLLERGLTRIASVQQIQGRFETLLKSTEKATERVKELYKFTASSPFNFQQVAEANRILEALSHGALSGARGMKLVGDAAAATGSNFEDVAEQVGKLYNALRSGRSFERVLQNLQMTGVVTDELVSKIELAQSTGQDFATTWGMVEQSLERTSGGMANQAKGLDGLTQKLDNASKAMEQAFGQPFLDAQAKSIETTIKATENLTPVVQKMGQDLAPLLTFFTSLKNQVTVSTIATKGFADALGTVWSVAKNIFVGATVAVGASAIANSFKTIGSAISYLTGLRATTTIVKDYSQALGEMRRSQLLAQASSRAFASGNFLNGINLRALSLQSGTGVKLSNVDRAARISARTDDGGFNVLRYVGSAATQVAFGGIGLLRKGIIGIGGALRSFVTANPILVVGAAATAAADAFSDWADKYVAANNAQRDFLAGLGDIRTEARKSVEGAKTLDDWREAAADLATKLTDVREKLKGLSVQDPQFQEKFSELTRTGRMLNRQSSILNGRLPTIGLSKQEKADIASDTEKRLELQNAQRQAGAERGDDLGRLGFLNGESKRLELLGNASADNYRGIHSPERYRNNPTELMTLNRQIADRETKRLPVPKEMYERQAELTKNAENYRDFQIQKVGVDTERQSLGNRVAMKQMELEYDKQIAAEQYKGGNTAELEEKKRVAMLMLERDLATKQGRTLDAKTAQTQIDLLAGARGTARGQAGLDRARDDAAIRRDRRGAQAVDDFRARQALEGQYAANGMSKDQADADFRRHILAEAAAQQPRVVADSLQSIGGGGGFFESNPMVQAQKRMEVLAKQQTGLLEIIARNATGKIN